jgi:hypothetical protein
MSAYLKQFKEKMQSAEKGDEVLSLEDARWHLEAVLNYTYGDAGHQTSDIQVDTFYYKLYNQNEEMTLAQLNEIFNEFSNSVEEVYAECTLPDKSVLAIQIKYEKEKRNDDITVQTILITRGLTPYPVFPCFDSTDFWDEYYEEDENGYYAGGKCGPYVGQGLDSGAPNELTKKLLLRLIPNECYYGTGYFTNFTDDFRITMDGEHDPFLYDENSPCGYKLFYNNRYPYDINECIDPTGMNYYLSKGPELIEHFAPEGKVIVTAKYCWSQFVGFNSDRSRASFHYIQAVYAEFNCNDSGSLD